MRITEKNLVAMVNRLNNEHGFENPKWNTVGSFKLRSENGGYSIAKVKNDGGGIQTIGGCYGMTTRECYYFLNGLLATL